MVVIVFKVILLQILRISLVLTQIEKVYYRLQQANKQWGFRSDTGYGGRTVTFPIAFTKQCFNGHVTTKRGGDSSNGNNYVDKLTTTNMWTVCDGGGGYWLAIGV